MQDLVISYVWLENNLCHKSVVNKHYVVAVTVTNHSSSVVEGVTEKLFKQVVRTQHQALA